MSNFPSGIILQAIGNIPFTSATGATLNAAAEEAWVIGQIFLPARTGSKVISSAGGAIYWLTASGVTFADAGTTLRVGIQDINLATGAPDGTFDVSADLVGGTDTLASSSFVNTPMEAGSKTLTHGDTVAIGFSMISRGGADQVTMDRVDAQIGLPGQSRTFPYGHHLGTKNPESLQVMLKFDDGTVGWIYSSPLIWNTNNTAPTQITFGNASTPDEYIGTFSFANALTIDGIGASIGGIIAGDDYELILYGDPYGTPVVIESVAPDPDVIGVTNVVPYFRLLSTPRDLLANTKYGIALRPTTANTIIWGHLDLTSGFDFLKNGQPFTTIQMAARSNQTGAFVETQVYHLPLITVSIAGFSSAAGGAFVY